MSLPLVDHTSSDGVTIKIPYRVHALQHRPALHPIFPIGLVKIESDSTVRSTKTGSRR